MACCHQSARNISIHAPRGGSDFFTASYRSKKEKFQSTLPVGGATPVRIALHQLIDISIHAPRGGSDRSAQDSRNILGVFQSTLPVGGATTWANWNDADAGVISIHAPRGGSDGNSFTRDKCMDDFNPRSPWGERLSTAVTLPAEFRFQSTLPVGGATYEQFFTR